MHINLAGKTALVTASTGGIGFAIAHGLALTGAIVIINGRSDSSVEKALARLSEAVPQATFSGVAADLGNADGVGVLTAALPTIDILVNNAGGPPPGMWSDWDREDFIKALDANMLAPIAMIKALVPAMMDRGWGRVVNITSQSVRAPIGVLGLSNSARTGLTGYVAGTSRQVAGKGVTINNLLPGIHATDRADALDGGVVKQKGITLEEARTERASTIPAGRYGTRHEFGAACAFLCSQHAGFIVGQNLLLDGGATNITM